MDHPAGTQPGHGPQRSVASFRFSLPAANPTPLSQDSYDVIAGGGEADHRFGQALATGDFNGDGLADVAIGNGSESFGSRTDQQAADYRRGLERAASISSRRRATSASNALMGRWRLSVNLMPPLVDSKPSKCATTLSTTAGLNGNTE